MNCESIKDRLFEYMDGSIDAQQKMAMDQHLESCSQCQALVEYETLLSNTLRTLPHEEPSIGYHQRVFENIDQQKHLSHQKKIFFAGFGTAMAASLAAWLFLSATIIAPVEQNSIDQINVTLNSISHVRLSFVAPDNFSDVKLSIVLPDHIEIEGFPGQKTISWNTSLTPGTNILSLPVVAKGIQSGVIETRISNEEKSKTFKLRIHVQKDINLINT